MVENNVKFAVGVILPAAGSGTRLPYTPGKQYFCIQNKPLFLYPIEKFEDIPWVTKIVLVVDDVARAQNILHSREGRRRKMEKITVTLGGDSRHRSIQAGLAVLEKTCPDCVVVVVHDAVRPLVPEELFRNVVDAAEQWGAAGLTRPLISTVIAPSKDDHFLDHSLPRAQYLNSETPQAFQKSVLLDAYKKISDEELENGTECLQLVLEHCGVKAKLIEGTEDLWKVTLQRDLYSAIGCITKQSSRVFITSTSFKEDYFSLPIAKLEQSLNWQVDKHSIYSGGLRYGSPSSGSFNKRIIFHEIYIDAIKYYIDKKFASKEITTEVHVIENLVRQDESNLYKQGKEILLKQSSLNYDKSDVSVIVIFWQQSSEHAPLVELISNVVLNGSIFSGQIFII